MKYLLIILSFMSCYALFSQKEGNIGILGYGSSWTIYDSIGGNTSFDFNFSPTHIERLSNCTLDFHETCASICDENGNLLFYTNGVVVANMEHDTMENGMGLNPGYDTDNYASGGASNMQGAIILPYPLHDKLYYIIHQTMEKAATSSALVAPQKLMYTLVDMSANSGKGKVIEKNIPFIQDTIAAWGLTACRHANGRDWWMMVREDKANCYYRVLISPKGIEVLGKDCLGLAGNGEGYMQAYFSPDGEKFAGHEINNIALFDFDRCNGTFSNPRYIPVPHNSPWWWLGGLSFAPNSKYLYFSSELFVYQLDTDATDVAASMQLVAEYDTIKVEVPPSSGVWLPVPFWFMGLAPNGKIYIVPPNAAQVMHVIEEPDLPGLACNLVQRGQPLPTINAYTIPNFPNFRLGAAVGSGCDTLVSYQSSVSSEQVIVYPNPAQDVLTIEIPTIKGNFTCIIYNTLGQKVYEMQINQTSTKIFVGNWAKGAYFYEISTNNHKEYGKFFIE